jgi:hypothetical protein
MRLVEFIFCFYGAAVTFGRHRFYFGDHMRVMEDFLAGIMQGSHRSDSFGVFELHLVTNCEYFHIFTSLLTLYHMMASSVNSRIFGLFYVLHPLKSFKHRPVLRTIAEFVA